MTCNSGNRFMHLHRQWYCDGKLVNPMLPEHQSVSALTDIHSPFTQLMIEPGMAKKPIGNHVGKNYADHRCCRQFVVTGQLEHNQDRRKWRTDHRTRDGNRPTDREYADFRMPGSQQ